MGSKRIKITQELERQIRFAVGDEELDTSPFAVFEARALSSKPIKQGGFYNGAVVSRNTMVDISAFLNKEGGAVALQIMHDTNVLPVGKVFSAKLVDNDDGYHEIHTQFYLTDDQEELIAGIEKAVIDEVSVSFLPERAACSECGFDYFSKESDMFNFMMLTCDEGHTIGEEGVHVRLTGLQDFSEMSLVNRGASQDAKILSRAKQRMNENTNGALAAAAKNDPKMVARLCSSSVPLDLSNNINPKGDFNMDKETLALLDAKSTEIAETKAKLSSSETKATELEGTVAELTKTIETKDAEIVTLTENNEDGEKLVKLQAELDSNVKEMTELETSLASHVKAALTASGVAETDLPKGLAASLKVIEEKGLKLHQIFGAKPVSASDKDDVDNPAGAKKASFNKAFKSI